MIEKNVQQLRYIFFTSFILLQVFIILFSNYNFGIGSLEDIKNYQAARFSFLHPNLFFDLHETPLYRIIISPFTLLGFRISRSLNLILSVFILFFTLEIAEHLYGRKSLFLIFLIAFSPAYFFVSSSCLPELLFGFLLVAGLYLFTKNRVFLSSIVISFIPVVYVEGFLILLPFLTIMLFIKSYHSIPLLLSGVLVFLLAGYFVFGDFLWFFSQHLGSRETVTTGTLGFLYKVNFAFGPSLLIMFTIGLCLLVYNLFKKFTFSDKNKAFYLLVATNILIVLVIGFWLEAKTKFNIILVSAVPLFAIISGNTLNFIKEKVTSKKAMNTIFSAMVVLQVLFLLLSGHFHFKLNESDRLIKRGANYIRYNEPNEKVFYSNPIFTYFFNIDPYNTTKSELFSEERQIANEMSWNDILVWDSEYGGGKYNINLSTLENDPNLEKLEAFYLHDKTIEVDENDKSLQIFKKLKGGKTEIIISDTYERTLSFEDYLDPRVKKVDGIKAWEVDSLQLYSPGIELTRDVIERKEFLNFDVTLNYKSMNSVEKANVAFVFSIINEGKNIYYESKFLDMADTQWKESKLNVTIPADIPRFSSIRAFVVNRDKKQILIQNIKIKIRSH